RNGRGASQTRKRQKPQIRGGARFCATKAKASRQPAKKNGRDVSYRFGLRRADGRNRPLRQSFVAKLSAGQSAALVGLKFGGRRVVERSRPERFTPVRSVSRRMVVVTSAPRRSAPCILA